MLRNSSVTEWSVAVGPLSATGVPLHLIQFTVPLVQLLHLCACKARDSTQFLYDTCNSWNMILGTWVNLIHCSFIQLGRLPTRHLTG